MTIQKRYCVNGTVGHKILNGQKRLEFEKGQVTEVKMSVQYMSFSAHADAKVIFLVFLVLNTNSHWDWDMLIGMLFIQDVSTKSPSPSLMSIDPLN